MNCQNCGIEIPPTWTAALTSNSCPACGQPIMDEQTQTLTKELSEALKVMPANAEAIAGWLISNYKLTKINSYDPVVSNTKPKRQNQQASSSPVANGQPLTPADLLKNAKTDIDYDKIVKEAAIARSNKFPPSIVREDSFSADESEVEVPEDEDFDVENVSNNELNRIMQKLESSALPASKELQAEYKKIAMKQQLARDSLESGVPSKGGFCRAG